MHAHTPCGPRATSSSAHLGSLLPKLLSISFACSWAAAQTTTWTSFEDRAGHAIAADPQAGVLMFGGASLRNSGTLLDDTSRLNSSNTTWSREGHTTRPLPRRGHAMVAAQRQGQPVYVVFGGVAQSGANQVQVADTWVHQGGGWGPRGPAIAPSARTGHAMVTDFVRNKVYLVGGLGGALPRNDVFEFDPELDTWSVRLPNQVSPTTPPQRRNHCLAYDPGLDRVILFGGQGFAGSFGDTWSYDPVGNVWTNMSPATSPPPRGEGAMAYLLGFGVVLFGGRNTALPPGQQVLGDTWVFNGVTWTQATNLPATPPARFGHAMSFDQSAQHVVLLGGSDAGGAPIPGTWLWNGTQWAEQLPAPLPRNGAALAYDEVRSRHVMFGGRASAGGADLDQTWEIDGVNWRQRAPGTSPSARSDAGIAFDKSRNRTVVFGGRSQAMGQELGDTWEWNGATWTPRVTTHMPPAAGGAQMVYDEARARVSMLVGSSMWNFDGVDWSAIEPAGANEVYATYDGLRGVAVRFGGKGPAGINTNETWEWNRSRWQRRTFSGPVPDDREAHGMAFDPVRGKVVLFGGFYRPGGTPIGPMVDTWEYDGTSWTQRFPAQRPSHRYGLSMVYDPAIQKVLLFGGEPGGGIAPYAETWGWDGTNWTPLAPQNAPTGRSYMAMTYDSARARVVVYGGIRQGVALADTWTWDGSNWHQEFPANGPGARFRVSMAYDVARSRVVLFGGEAYGGSFLSFRDTWEWDGLDWTLRSPATLPVARHNQGMVYDPNLGRVVMFHGLKDALSLAVTDTWAWDGVDWQLLDSTPPATRTNYGAAYDARRDRTVVFGGMSTNNRASATYSNETWEWDGDSWLQRFPTVAPPARGWGKLSYDAARSRVVLYGGADATNTFDDTWEWDGTTWTQQNPEATPPSSLGHDLSYDTTRNVVVGFGEFGTWDYGPLAPASAVAFPAVWPAPATCVGSLGAIRMQLLPWSGPWLGDRFEVDFVNRPANSLGLFLWSFTNATWNSLPLPIPLALLNVPSPCNLLVDPFVTELVLAPRYQSFALPSDPILLSVPMFVQAGFFDNGPQGTQIVTTNGLELQFGRK